MRTRACASAALAALSAAISGVASAQVGSAEAAGVEAARVPALAWTACGDGGQFECATASVPLDYTVPDGQTIDLALTRLPASDPSQRIGSLFVNPGGPGESGVGFVQSKALSLYSEEVRTRFDIVGFDPRFVGASRKAQCITSDEGFSLFDEDFHLTPVTIEQERIVAERYAQYAGLCAERMPDMQYASTGNAARDLELLRRAVGDERLSYAGYSYGTVLGQTYAALYPNHVRAILLDGVADAESWSGSPETMSVPLWVRTGAAVGTAEALQEFFRRCREAGAERCPIASHGDPATVFAQLADALRSGPLPNINTSYDYSWLTHGALLSLYVPKSWDMYAYEVALLWRMANDASTAPEDAELEQAEQARRAIIEADPWYGARQLLSADDPAPDLSDSRGSKFAVACADTLNPSAFEDWSRAAAEEEARAEYFGRLWTYDGAACASWSLPAPGRYSGPYHLPTSAPILIASPRFDPATPLQAARDVARKLPGARLVVLDGVGHTTGSLASRCMDSVVTRYFVDGVLPAPDTVCASETEYFADPILE